MNTLQGIMEKTSRKPEIKTDRPWIVFKMPFSPYYILRFGMFLMVENFMHEMSVFIFQSFHIFSDADTDRQKFRNPL